jgi:hypothetical protein
VVGGLGVTPVNIVVLQGDNEHRIENVETWWYDDLDLVIRFPDEETATYPGGNVMERF